jgi:mlo protein
MPSGLYFGYADPLRFRLTHQTSFVKRHMGLSSVTGVRWIVSFCNFISSCDFHLALVAYVRGVLCQVAFFRQFFRSVTKVDYLTLRQGFINVLITISSPPLLLTLYRHSTRISWI